MFSRRMRIRKTCKETRKFSTTLTRVGKKRRAESAEKMIAGAAFVGCTRWNTKKKEKKVEHFVRRVSGDCSLREGRRFQLLSCRSTPL